MPYDDLHEFINMVLLHVYDQARHPGVRMERRGDVKWPLKL